MTAWQEVKGAGREGAGEAAAGALMGCRVCPGVTGNPEISLWGNPRQALSRLFLLRLEIFPYSKKHFTRLFLARFILSQNLLG